MMVERRGKESGGERAKRNGGGEESDTTLIFFFVFFLRLMRPKKDQLEMCGCIVNKFYARRAFEER